MGIKFYCPNGHKLNVKTFLGGKKAICPKCGAKVIVPLEGTTGPAAEDMAGASGDQDRGVAFAQGLPGIAPAISAAAGTGLNDFVYDYAATAAASLPTSTAPLAQAASPLPVESSVQPNPSSSVPGTSMIDPIDEAPAAVWYVRPPSGGQYGPAAGPTMRAWIQEGRVTANSLVWRDGWPEWRSAAATFPSLVAGQAAWGGPAAAPMHGAPMPGAMSPQPVGVAPLGNPAAGWHGGAMTPGAMTPGAMTPGGMAPAGMAPGGMMPYPAAQQGMSPMGVPLTQQAGVPAGHVMSALETPLGGYEMEADMSRTRKRRGKKGPDVTSYVAIALVVMTVILVVILAIVISQQSSESDEAPAPAGKASQKAEDSDTEDAPAPTEGKKAKKAKSKPAMEESGGGEKM